MGGEVCACVCVLRKQGRIRGEVKKKQTYFSSHNTFDTKCVGCLPPTNFSTLWTLTGCPKIWFNSDTDCQNWAADPPCWGLRPTRVPPAQMPLTNPGPPDVWLTWRQIRGSYDLLLRLDNLQWFTEIRETFYSVLLSFLYAWYYWFMIKDI